VPSFTSGLVAGPPLCIITTKAAVPFPFFEWVFLTREPGGIEGLAHTPSRSEAAP